MALSVPLAGLAAWALSESLFILLATLALMQTDRFLAGGQRAALLAAAVFSALAWQTRYIGVAVPVAVGLLLLTQPGAAWPQRAKHIALVAAVALLPMGGVAAAELPGYGKIYPGGNAGGAVFADGIRGGGGGPGPVDRF